MDLHARASEVRRSVIRVLTDAELMECSLVGA